MSTSVRVNTYAHSITYLSDEMLRSLKRIINLAGLDIDNFLGGWSSTSLAIQTWLKSRDMKKIVLEIYNPRSEKLVTRWDIGVDYTLDPEDDGEFWTDTDALIYAIKKCGEIPSNCKYDIIISTKNGRPDVPGWGSCEFRSTAGLVNRSLGSTIDAGTVGANTSYWS